MVYDGICRMVVFDAQRDMVIIAFEPSRDDPGWESLEPNSMILVAEEHPVSLRP